jgi:type IV secretory pathway VirJ component
MVKHFLTQWKIKSWYLIGYSFGADVAPFILNRLDHDALALPEACVLLDPSETTDFEIHVTDMVSFSNTIRRFKVTDEILHVQRQTLCLFPKEDKRTLPTNQNHFLSSVELPGDHRFDHNISAITRIIYSFLHRTR